MSQKSIGTKINILNHIGDLESLSPLLEKRPLLTVVVDQLEIWFSLFLPYFVEVFRTIKISTVTFMRVHVPERHVPYQMTFTICSSRLARPMIFRCFYYFWVRGIQSNANYYRTFHAWPCTLTSRDLSSDVFGSWSRSRPWPPGSQPRLRSICHSLGLV